MASSNCTATVRQSVFCLIPLAFFGVTVVVVVVVRPSRLESQSRVLQQRWLVSKLDRVLSTPYTLAHLSLLKNSQREPQLAMDDHHTGQTPLPPLLSCQLMFEPDWSQIKPSRRAELWLFSAIYINEGISTHISEMVYKVHTEGTRLPISSRGKGLLPARDDARKRTFLSYYFPHFSDHIRTVKRNEKFSPGLPTTHSDTGNGPSVGAPPPPPTSS